MSDITAGTEIVPKKGFTALELMNMNRHERRKIGRVIKMKIPGLQSLTKVDDSVKK